MKKRFKFKKRNKIKLRYLLIFIYIILFYKFSGINFININSDILKKIFNYNMNNKSLLIENITNYINNDIFHSLKTSTQSKFMVFNKIEKNNEPLIYIYNSHQGENYNYEYLEEYNIVPSVITAANMLKEKLENLNINTIVEENDILLYMKNNNMNHADSYKASRIYLNKIVNEYPNIILYIDLHRDAATHDVTTTYINDLPCAKVLFVIGLENENYQKNLAITEQINNIINNNYPTLSRGIMKKQGIGVNGVYNQDVKENVILLEVGGNNNNIEEVNNTLDILAQVIGEYINEKEKI